MREIRDREFPAAGGEQVYHFLQSTEKQTENERKYYEKILEKSQCYFYGSSSCRSNDSFHVRYSMQAAVRLTITIQLQQLQAKAQQKAK